MPDTTDVYKIALAGLLHDIGKLGQRAFDYKQGLSTASENLEKQICIAKKEGWYSHLHTMYTNEFFRCVYEKLPEDWSLDISLTSSRELAIYHHKPSTDQQKIITEADHLSSAMERIEDESSKGHFRKVCLHAIVNEVQIDDIKRNSDKYLHQMQAFEDDVNTIFPEKGKIDENQINNYLILWEALLNEWKNNQIPDPWKYINRSLSILEKYTWCIPSATNGRPDISLFDHLKTTSALALCLYTKDDNDYPFIIVTGDFSGIQNYIFDLHHGAGGTAKTLRGRSFKVGLFSDAVALYILKSNNCPLTHNLMTAGGHFYLLLPNTKSIQENLEKNRSNLENWLLTEYKGAFRFNLAWTEISKQEIKNFPLAIDKVRNELEREKSQPFRNVLIQNKWIPDNFIADKLDLDDEKICKSCYKRPGDIQNDYYREKYICSVCADDRETGRKILKNPFISFDMESDYPPVYKWKIGEQAQVTADHIILTEYAETPDIKLPLNIVRKAIYIPTNEDNEPLEFSEIAERSTGRPALAFLKADVDNLGYIFKKGFTDQEGSISRIATLSRMLDSFFSAYLKQLVEKKFPNIYIVYAGGDDLMMIGPWNEIFDFTLEMREKFREFTCFNKSWGLSAGIALSNASTPVLSAVKGAEDQLTKSKDRDGKDGFTAFGETMSWDEASEAITFGKKVVRWLQDGTISSGQIRRLFTYSQMWQEYKQGDYYDTRLLRYIPQLVYDIRRNWPAKTEDEQEAVKWALSLTYPDKEPIRKLYFICQYALNGARTS